MERNSCDEVISPSDFDSRSEGFDCDGILEDTLGYRV